MKSAKVLAICGVAASAGAGAVVWNQTAPAVPDHGAEAALPELLTKVYRAYALEDEYDIYDALSQAVAGNNVKDLYLQRRQAQVADHAEDGQTQILSVEVYQIEPLAAANTYHTAWRVVGRVRHAAHIHERINLYAADLTLGWMNDGWKLTDLVLTNSDRETDYNFEGGE